MSVTSINSCATVKKHSVVEKDGKKYLALRIKNSLQETITGFDVKVRQYDKNGRSIGTVVLSTSTLSDGDGDFVWVSKVPLSDKCDHCEPELKRVWYGDYSYTRHGEGVTLTYSDGIAKSRDARAFYLKSEDGNSQVLSHNYVKHAVGVGVLSVILIILALAVCIFQIEYFSITSNEFAMSGVIYEFVDKNKEDGSDIIISGYNGRYTDVNIPEKIDGHTVVGIDPNAFAESSYIRSLTINSPTLSVPAGAFKNCANLKTVKLIGVKNVGDSAFYNCKNLNRVEMPNIEVIGASAFTGTGLRTLDLSDRDRVTIGANAFSNCLSLEEVKFSETVEFGGSGTVFMLSGVKSVEFGTLSPNIDFAQVFGPDNVIEKISAAELEKIPDEFCVGLTKLQSFTVDSLADKNIGEGAFRNLESLSEFDVGEAVTSIGREAFYNSGIKSIDLSNIDNIDEYSFYNCRALEKVVFSKDLESIGTYAFYGCASLKSIELPSSTSNVGSHAFEACASLRDVDLNNVMTLGDSAFASSGITKIVFPDGIGIIGENVLYNASSLVELKTPHFHTAERPGLIGDLFGGLGYVPKSLARVHVTLPSSVSGVELSGLSYVKEIILPNGLQTIGQYAFSGCTALETINMPAELAHIGSSAFSGCYNLATVNLPEGLEDIYYGAFSNSGIKELVVPEGTSLTYGSLFGMGYIQSLVIKDLYADSQLANLAYIFGSEQSRTLKTVHITDMLEMNDYAFNGFTALETVKIDGTPSKVSYRAFSGCSALTSITLPSGITSIEDYAFNGCSSLASVVLPNGLKSLGAYAFSGCTFESLKIPNETAVSSNALSGMYALKEVTLPSTRTDGGDSGLFYRMFGNSAYYLPSSLVKVVLTDETTLPSGAFEDCEYIQTVVLPDGLISIGGRAFRNCGSLSSITLPENLDDIGYEAFYGCYKLYSVYNLSDYIELSIGSTSYGYVAYYALRIMKNLNESLNIVSVGDFGFTKDDDGSWHLIQYTGDGGEIALPANFTSGGVTVSSYNVGTKLFYGSNITKLTIPKAVRKIGLSAFSYCVYLQSVSFADGCDIDLSESAFENDVNLAQVTFGTNVDLYADYANIFRNCYALTSVSLPDNMEYIGAWMFGNCSALKEVKLPGNLKYIGDNAFYNCNRITEIVLPAKLESIGDGAFSYCYHLYAVCNLSTHFALSAGNTNYGSVAYYALKISTDSAVHKNSIKDIDGYKFLLADDGYYLIGCDKREVVLGVKAGSGVTVNQYSIAPYLFQDSNITTASIEEAVIGIGEYAFNGCFLNRLTISCSGAGIDGNAFSGCGTNEFIIRTINFASVGMFYGMRASSVYYKGTQEQWDLLNVRLSYSYFYVYAPCVHIHGEWTEIDGQISISIPPREQFVKKEATCTETGTRVERCSLCKTEFQSYVIPMIEHSFGEDGECSMCHSVRTIITVSESNFAELFDSDGFEFVENGAIASTGENASMTFTADRVMTLEFFCNVDTENRISSSFDIYINDEPIFNLAYGSNRFNRELSEGDIVRFVFTNAAADGSVCYITNMYITYITPGEESDSI